MSFRPVLIKPTYDVANFGEDISITVKLLSGSTATLTPSTATFCQVLEDSKVPIDAVDQFITDSDSMAMIHAGNDTDFDKNVGVGTRYVSSSLPNFFKFCSWDES